MYHEKMWKKILMLALIICMMIPTNVYAEDSIYKVKYRVHVSDIGWMNYVGDKEIAGTVGQSRSMEAIQIEVENIEGVGISYKAYVNGIGWQDSVVDGSTAGTTGKSTQMEAIQIILTGENADLYDVYYRVHSAEIGWLDWAKNGASAGTVGYDYAMQAIQIVVVEKDSSAPGSTGNAYSEKGTSVEYSAHVSEIGWMPSVSDGTIAGTTGKSLSMEALKINVSGIEDVNVSYSAHVSDIGWMPSAENGAVSGTTGQKRQMEAIKITLTGTDAEKYDIYYQAHVAELGWLGWAKNGESAGSTGYKYAMQAIKIKLVEKGGQAPGSTQNAFVNKNSSSNQTNDTTTDDTVTSSERLICQAHVSEIGWMSSVGENAVVGTTGKSLPLEAVKIKYNGDEDIKISYSAHVSEIGWMDTVTDGSIAGTTGKKLAMEAIKISLSGSDAEKYDIYYRAHVSEYGWLDWAKNGEIAGTVGLSRELQAIEISIVEKDASAPGVTSYPYLQKVTTEYKSLVGNLTWQNTVKNGATSGTTGQDLPIRAFSVTVSNMNDLGIKYSAHVSDIGWQSYVSNGQIAGVEGNTNQVEAIQMLLTGNTAKYYDIWYRVYAENIGWLDWACNGAKAGTSSLQYAAEAIQVVVKAKGSTAPGNTEEPFVDKIEESYLWPVPSSTRITSYFGYRTAPTAGASTYHQGIDIGASTGEIIVATKSGTVTACAYNSTRGYYVEVTHDDGVKTIYMHMSRQAVTTGTRVIRGQTLGYIGSTGVATGPHLHFSVVVNGTNVNPLNYVSP